MNHQSPNRNLSIRPVLPISHTERNELHDRVTSLIGFVPTSSTVVVGKGVVPKKAPGNHKLKAIVQKMANKYDRSNKAVRSSIVTDIFFSIQRACHDEGNSHSFVRYQARTSSYFKISESIARDKISATFRDSLHDKYRSSSKNKSERRRNLARKNQSIRMQQLLNPLEPKSFPISSPDTSMSSSPSPSPAIVASSGSREEPSGSSRQEKKLDNYKRKDDFLALYKKLFSSIPGESSTIKPIDESSFLADIEPVPISELEPVPLPELDCVSICSSSSSRQSSSKSIDDDIQMLSWWV